MVDDLELDGANKTSELKRSFYLTYRELIAAMEVFGRDTRLVEITHSDLVYGALSPKTVGAFTDILQFACKDTPDKPSALTGIYIVLLYNEFRALTALALSPYSTEELDEKICIDMQAGRTWITYHAGSEEILNPDYEAICVNALNNVLQIELEELGLDIHPASGEKAEVAREAWSLLDRILPDRSVRTDRVDQVRKAVATVAPIPA